MELNLSSQMGRNRVEVKMPRNFWMIASNEANFNITQQLGFVTQGLKSQHRRKVQRIEVGDRVLFYVTGVRKFTGTATVTAAYREENTSQWEDEGSTGWPYEIGIKSDVILEKDQHIEAGLLAHRLDYVRRWAPEDWYLAFQGNLHLLPKNDFFIIEEEMKKLKLGSDYQYVAQPIKNRNQYRRRRGGGRNKGNKGTEKTASEVTLVE